MEATGPADGHAEAAGGGGRAGARENLGRIQMAISTCDFEVVSTVRFPASVASGLKNEKTTCRSYEMYKTKVAWHI